MLRFITNTPLFVLREITPEGVNVEDVDHNAPLWATAILTGYASPMLEVMLANISGLGFRVDGLNRPRPAISDPTFALAAARIDRS